MQKEINKLLKRVNVELLKNNHKECVELYNIVGGLYSEIGSYDEAIHYHEKALETSKTIGDRLGTAVAFRYIGEAHAALGKFSQAIDYIKKYLNLAERSGNKVEGQRAWTTLGRIYLMQAQDMKESSSGNIIDKETKNIAREAETRFHTALKLAEEVRSQIDNKEYEQMRSGLLINLGLVNDICGQHDDAVTKFRQAIKICEDAKLKEDLFRCYIILAGIFRQRMKDKDISMAAMVSEKALQTAKSVGKKLLICDALMEQGFVRICQRNFKDAKKKFTQAYLEKSPSEDDHSKAIKMLKLSHLIYTTYEKVRRDDTPGDARLKLCDKLGDLFIAINNYKLAIDFYKKALEDAHVCAKPKSELARILYSLAETYADDGQYESALKCYKRELSLRNGNNSEQCQSLIKIAHMHEYLDHEIKIVCDCYENALEKADKDPKLMHSVLRYYVPYMKQKSCTPSRCKTLEEMLLNLKSFPEVVEEIENEDYEEVNDLEDEIVNIEDIISDDEDNSEVLMVGKRKSRGASKFKPNEVGDTPLHEASIKGDLKRVKWLIEQGHEVNPRDNAGWIPLHESCNHGHTQIAEYLIQHGADVNHRGLKGVSPLHDAATNGHFDIMRILLSNGANAISLTDTGETVLSCLRDYKKRNYSKMSNNEMSEYKYMEAELLNIMDKCGFNLMSENIKNLANNKSSKPSSAGALQEEVVRPKPRVNLMNGLERPVSNPVKDYRDAMGTLKRKRLKDDDRAQEDATVKPSQPAVYHSSMSTSASTKEWLIDDVSRQKQIVNRRSNLADLLESDNEILFSDDAEVREVPQARRDKPLMTTNKKTRHEKSTNSKRILLDSDDSNENELFRERTTTNNKDGEDDVMFIGEDSSKSIPSLRSPVLMDNMNIESPAPENNDQIRPPSVSLSSWSLSSVNRSSSAHLQASKNPSFDLFNQPLTVTIEERKLLIPIKDEKLTIGQLKGLIIERYSYLVNNKPNISLAPCNDPTCLLFDDDLCKDVIQDNLLATIDSWQLQSIEESYVKNCAKVNLEPLTFIKIELRGLDETGNKMDISYMRFPRSHMRPILLALARRDFTSANFTGASCLFEHQQQLISQADDILATISTWNKLARLTLKCVGLTRSRFESIFSNCSGSSSSLRLPELLTLDVSVNSIAYKSKLEFSKMMEKLHQTCPKLKNLDIRGNHLQFVKSIICEMSSSSSSLGAAPSSSPTDNTTTTTVEAAKNAAVGANNYADKLDLSKPLNLPFDMEVLAGHQSEYSVYSG